jgi:alpha/beta superfamily hydrolase
VVLVLHGGARRPDRPAVSPTQLSVLRMIPIARRLARAGAGELAVYRLLNSRRGWEPGGTPVDDARWALVELAQRHPRLPAALVGHSLGGRAAVLAAGTGGVHAAVSLAGWFEPTDRVVAPGVDLLFVHGDADRVASPAAAAAVARTARADSVDVVTVPGGKHAMLRHGRAFLRPATAFVVARMLGWDVQTSGPRWRGSAADTGAGRVELHAPQAGQTNRTPGM